MKTKSKATSFEGRISTTQVVGGKEAFFSSIYFPYKPMFYATLFLAVGLMFNLVPLVGQSSLKNVVRSVQSKTVKIFGAGGFRGLESYQTGVLVTGNGHVLTVWSYVLDSDSTTVTLDDGGRFQAKLVGYDPQLEIAILKIDSSELPFFDLNASVIADSGSRVLAFSNCYRVATGNEPVSVQRGVIAARTKLDARRGAFQSTYDRDAYVIDAMTNNPGAAGGVITDSKGRLLGLIGKELRDSRTGAWLNFAMPIDEISKSVDEILSGKKVVAQSSESKKPIEPMTDELLGFSLVPDVIRKTPPYIESVREDSAAFKAGLRRDDLVVEVSGRMTPSCNEVAEQLSTIDRDGQATLTVQRGSKFLVFELSLIGQ